MPPQLIVAQPFLLERQAERLGQREHLVVVAAMRSEQRPDAHWFAGLVVHAHRGH